MQEKAFLATVRTLATIGKKDLKLRELAIAITNPARTEIDKARRIFDFVRRSVTYTRDPIRLEDLQAPRRTLKLKAGDCDDVTILIGAMLQAIGIPVIFNLVRTNRSGPKNHIFPAALIRGEAIPLDTAQPRPIFGKTQYRIFDVTSTMGA